MADSNVKLKKNWHWVIRNILNTNHVILYDIAYLI